MPVAIAIGIECDQECGVEYAVPCPACSAEMDNGVEFAQCDACNSRTATPDSWSGRLWVNGRSRAVDTLCESCLDEYTVVCASCDDRISRDESCRTHGNAYCQSCYDDNYVTCESCNDTIERGDANTRGGDYYCDSCNSDMDDDDRESDDDDDSENCDAVRNYSYKPYPKFFGKGPLYLGVELEVNTNRLSDHAYKVLDVLGRDRVYLKEDSSITSGGFEIVTHPHSFPEQVKLWSGWMAPQGMSSHAAGECGMHVHVSRKCLSNLHIERLTYWLNSESNLDLVKKIAQRGSNHYSEIKPKRLGHSVRCYSSDRYEALNLTNDNTIEFRIFRGNVRKERILKNLEFVHAIVEFTRLRSLKELDSPAKFQEFVRKSRKQYPNLDEFINPPMPKRQGELAMAATASKGDL